MAETKRKEAAAGTGLATPPTGPEIKRNKMDELDWDGDEHSTQDLLALTKAAEQAVSKGGSSTSTSSRPAPRPSVAPSVAASKWPADPLQQHDAWADHLRRKELPVLSPVATSSAMELPAASPFNSPRLPGAPAGPASAPVGAASGQEDKQQVSLDADGKTFVERMLADSEERIGAIVKQSQADISKNLQAEVHMLFRKYDQSVQLQFQQQQNELNELRKIAKEAQDNFDRVWAEISSLRNGLAVSASVENTKDWQREQAFDALPDATCICINTKCMVDKESLSTALSPWLLDASLSDEDWKLGGPATALAKRWKLLMQGDKGLASRRVGKCLGLLKGSDGIYRRFFCKTPDGEQVEIYISRDKSRKQVQTELVAKKLGKVLEPLLPAGRLHVLKQEGLLTWKWKPLARVTCYAGKSYHVHWNPAVLRLVSINREEVLESLEALHGASADGIEWSL